MQGHAAPAPSIVRRAVSAIYCLSLLLVLGPISDFHDDNFFTFNSSHLCELLRAHVQLPVVRQPREDVPEDLRPRVEDQERAPH